MRVARLSRDSAPTIRTRAVAGKVRAGARSVPTPVIHRTVAVFVTTLSHRRWTIESVAKEPRELAALRAQLAAVAAAEGGPMDGPVPVRWLRDPTWRCTNAHVSKEFQTDRRRHRRCVFRFCEATVQSTFPEDRSGPLAARGVSAER